LLVGVSGSISEGRAKASSDIDFFVVSKRDRIFTTRFFCKLLLGRNSRHNRDPKPAGKICLNYFLSEDSLDFKPHNRKVINYHQHSIILFSRGDTICRLIKANQWLKPKFNTKNLIDHHLHGLSFPRRRESTNRVDSRLRGNDTKKSFIGNLEEWGLKSVQIWKIKKDPKTAKYPQKIVFSDMELRFHPPKGED
jgi:hypothetical protein